MAAPDQRSGGDAEADDDEADHHQEHEADELKQQHRDEHERDQTELRKTQQAGEEQRPERIEAAGIGHGEAHEGEEHLGGECREERDQPAEHRKAELDGGDAGDRAERGLSHAGAPVGALVVAAAHDPGDGGGADDDQRHQGQRRVRVVIQAGGVELDITTDHRPGEPVCRGGVVAVRRRGVPAHRVPGDPTQDVVRRLAWDGDPAEHGAEDPGQRADQVGDVADDRDVVDGVQVGTAAADAGAAG